MRVVLLLGQLAAFAALLPLHLLRKYLEGRTMKYLWLLVLLAAPLQAEWQLVASWSGSGPKTTDDFEIAAPKWRVVWSAEPSGKYGGVFQVTSHKSDGGGLVGLVANIANKAGSGDSVQRGAGKYYLKMNVANMDWQIRVEQGN